ncbi:type III-B CRISPR-associated protein Cas10/Cmr2 [[Limnothrix rosea] IAM M-220]|nr:type III-B CRISPR-associated protein Cas10/Cmr2 [[Limnothrix rosea] IAM M-220]
MAGKAYWQAKIWGLLHDPALKALHKNSGRGEEGPWTKLACMEGWASPKSSEQKKASDLNGTWLDHVGLSDLIASASDRGIIHYIGSSVDYGIEGLELSHLLSGEKLPLRMQHHDEILGQGDRHAYLNQAEADFIDQMPAEICDDPDAAQVCFWWLWRCLPQAVADQFGAESLLMPAETRLPDGSIWSHASMTAAIAGALAGYDTEPEDIPKGARNIPKSHPHLAVFTFSPVQELIKASRKMKDFWAGSWILHYLSAKVCWRLAHKYGADCFLYPSLYGQPLIDHWLRDKYPDFAPWISAPTDRQLLTAGFPNVIMLVLPEEKVAAAMQSAKNHLFDAWREIAKEVLAELQDNRYWQKHLKATDPSWQGWLDAQWQTYWSAVAIGDKKSEFKSVGIPAQTDEKKTDLEKWIDQQNKAFNADLFQPAEREFFEQAIALFTEQRNRSYAGSLNAGSWWANIFGQTRLALNTVKNARNWKLPTAFGTRSTISGLGSVVHPQGNGKHRDWLTEKDASDLWEHDAGLFDGIEQLNATETVKRALEKVLPKILGLSDEEQIAASYPDLTSGVAGYLNTGGDRQYFETVCEKIYEELPWTKAVIREMRNKWGIPIIDKQPQKYHPRLLNAGWLAEDLDTDELKQLKKQLRQAKQEKNDSETSRLKREIRALKRQCRQNLQKIIDKHYPNNNPASWYVLAAGDGDGMSDWLKGTKMEAYKEYFPKALNVPDDLKETFDKFRDETKRMGPATHNALSRALLDFSNQLAPYLTEERYAGRLIYSGGDDVLAYTNLWEWDKWLWDIRQAFRGAEDDQGEFENKGDYWQSDRFERPLFTMGGNATISFGLVIAHHSVPLAIALENLWEAEEGAKDHEYEDKERRKQKDAVQLRVIYSNGNILKATCKFDTFKTWQKLLTIEEIEPSTFETTATLLEQHPIPVYEAIEPWVNAFTERRSNLSDQQKVRVRTDLKDFLKALWVTTDKNDRAQEAKNWLKAAAFNLRNRDIKLGGINHATAYS